MVLRSALLSRHRRLLRRIRRLRVPGIPVAQAQQETSSATAKPRPGGLENIRMICKTNHFEERNNILLRNNRSLDLIHVEIRFLWIEYFAATAPRLGGLRRKRDTYNRWLSSLAFAAKNV